MHTRFHALSSLLVVALAGCGTAPPAKPPAPPAIPGIAEYRTDGKSFVTGSPTVEGLAAAKQAGVTVVVSTFLPDEGRQKLGYDEAKACGDAGLVYVAIPLNVDKIERADVDRFAKVMADHDAGRVLVHCASGNRAAGLYTAWLALHQGVPLEQAIAQGKALGLAKEPTIIAVNEVVTGR